MKRTKAIIICSFSALIIGIGTLSIHNRPLGFSSLMAKEIPKNLSNNLSTSQINPEIKALFQKNNFRAAQYQSLAPDFELRDLDNKVVRLSQFKGETVLLGFFTTW